MDDLNRHIDSKTEWMRHLFQMAGEVIRELPDGKKIFVKDLCALLGSKLEPPMDAAQIYPVVRLFIEGCPGVYLLKGRSGGLYKGNQEKPST